MFDTTAIDQMNAELRLQLEESSQSKESAIKNIVNRVQWGFADPKGKEDILTQGTSGIFGRVPGEGYSKEQIVYLPNGELGIRTPLGIKPVDPKGFQFGDLMGDLAESVGKGITTAGAVGAALIPGIGQNPAAIGLGAMGGEAIRQGIGEIMGVISPAKTLQELFIKKYEGKTHLGGLTQVLGEGAMAGVSQAAINKLIYGKAFPKQVHTDPQELLAIAKGQETGKYIDPVTGLELRGVKGQGATAGEKMAQITGKRDSNEMFDWAIEKIKSGHASDLDWNPATASGRFNERIGGIIEQKVPAAFKYLDDIRSSTFKTAWNNLPDEVKLAPVDTTPIRNAIDEILTSNGLLVEQFGANGESLGKVFAKDAFGAAEFKPLIPLYEQLQKPMSGEGLQKLKTLIGNLVNWDAFDGGNIAPTVFDKLGSKIYGITAKTLNEAIDPVGTAGYQGANATYHAISDLLDSARRYVRPMRMQSMFTTLSKDPAKKTLMMLALSNLDDALPVEKKFMESLMNTGASQVLADFGITGVAAGNPRNILQKYVLNPGIMMRAYKLADSLGRGTEFMAGPVGQALSRLLSSPAGRTALMETALPTVGRGKAQSLNSMLYRKKQ